MARWLAVAVAAAALLVACGGDDDEPPKATSPVSRSGTTVAEEADISPLAVDSDAFGDGEPIPERFTCEGENLSPDRVLGIAPGLPARHLRAALEGHVLAQGTLTGTFGR